MTKDLECDNKNCSCELGYDVQRSGKPKVCLSEKEFKAIRSEMLRDPRNYFAQTLSVLNLLRKILTSYAFKIPIVIFWFFIGLAILSPENYQAFLAIIKNLPQLIDSPVIGMLISIVLAFIFFRMIFLIEKMFLSDKNIFRKNRDLLIKKHLHIPYEEKIVVERFVKDMRMTILSSELNKTTNGK